MAGKSVAELNAERYASLYTPASGSGSTKTSVDAKNAERYATLYSAPANQRQSIYSSDIGRAQSSAQDWADVAFKMADDYSAFYNDGWKNADDSAEFQRSFIQASGSMLAMAGNWRQEFAGSREAQEYIDSVVNMISDMQKNAYSSKDYYSAWSDADEYQRALNGYNWHEKYSGKSYDELNAVLGSMSQGEEYNWLKAFANSDEVMTADDHRKALEAARDEKNRILLDGWGIEPWQAEMAGIGFPVVSIPTDPELDRLMEEIDRHKNYLYFADNAEKFGNIKGNADFAAMSKAYPGSKQPEMEEAFFTGGPWAFINNDVTGAMDKYTAQNGAVGGTTGGYDAKYANVTDEEKAIFNYVYNKAMAGDDGYSQKDVKDYLKYLDYALNERQKTDDVEKIKEWAEEHPFMASAFSVDANLRSGIGLLSAIATGGKETPVDYNSAAFKANTVAQTTRETVSGKLAEKGSISIDEEKHPTLAAVFNGKSWGDVYNLGMSMADSAAVLALAPVMGEWGTVFLGGSAGTQGMLDAVARGANDNQALAFGWTSGVFETLFEKLSIGELLKAPSKTLIREILKQGMVESSEELLTSIANNISDAVIMGEKSVKNTAIQDYINMGLSPEDARKRAVQEQAVSLFWDAAGGFITGGLMGGGKAVGGKVFGVDGTNAETKTPAEAENSAAPNTEIIKNHKNGVLGGNKAGRPTDAVPFNAGSNNASEALGGADGINTLVSQQNEADIGNEKLNSVDTSRAEHSSRENAAGEAGTTGAEHVFSGTDSQTDNYSAAEMLGVDEWKNSGEMDASQTEEQFINGLRKRHILFGEDVQLDKLTDGEIDTLLQTQFAAERGELYKKLMGERARRGGSADVSSALEYREIDADKTVRNESAANRDTFSKSERESVERVVNETTPEGELADNEHAVHRDERIAEDVKTAVDRYGEDAEANRLLSKQQALEDIEIAELQHILNSKLERLRFDQLFKTGKFYVEAYQNAILDIAALQAKIEAEKTRAARTLRQTGKQLITPKNEVFSRAVRVLLGNGGLNIDANTGTVTREGNFSPNSDNAEVVRKIVEHLDKIESFSDGDFDGIISEIKDISHERGTDRLLGGAFSKSIDKALKFMARQADGAEYLKTLAYAQADAITTDRISGFRGSALEGIKSVRISNMLSNPKTWVNNIGNNFAAQALGSVGQNLGVLPDKLLSKITGTRTIGIDSSLRLNTEQRAAVKRAFYEAALNTLFDVNTDGSKFESTGGNNFKMIGGWGERFLANYNTIIRAALEVPDEVTKARTRAGLDRGRNELSGITEKARAELKGDSVSESRYRTLQQDNKLTGWVNELRDELNKFGVRDKKGGSLGLGDIIAPFAKVPTNVILQRAKNTPIGWACSAAKLVDGYVKAKNGTLSATEQARISRDVGRSMGGMGFAGLAFIAAMKGILKNYDDDDRDRSALEKSMGLSGLQLNLSALFRVFQGDGAELREGDTLIGGDWLEILAAPISVGVMLYEAATDEMSAGEMLELAVGYSAGNLVNSASEIPGLDSLARIFGDMKNGEPVGDTLLPELANTASSFVIPNAMAQAAAGIDNTQRNIYDTDDAVETALNILRQKELFLRKSMDAKLNGWGEELKYGDDHVMGFLNRMLLPGAVRQYEPSDVESEIKRLSDGGFTGMYPKNKLPDKFTAGEKDFELSTDERRRLEKTTGHIESEMYEDFICSEIYGSLSDEQRKSVLYDIRSYALNEAKQDYLDSIDDDAELNRDKWETELSGEEITEYLSAKQIAKSLYDKDGSINDFEAMDEFLTGKNSVYGMLSYSSRELLKGSWSRLDDMYEAAKAGISSSEYDKAYRLYKSYNAKDYNSSIRGRDLKTAISGLGLSKSKTEWLNDNLKIMFTAPANTDTYDKLTAAGIEAGNANSLMDQISILPVLDGHGGVTKAQIYRAIDGSGIPDYEKWKAFSVYATDAAKREGELYKRSGYSFSQFAKMSDKFDLG